MNPVTAVSFSSRKCQWALKMMGWLLKLEFLDLEKWMFFFPSLSKMFKNIKTILSSFISWAIKALACCPRPVEWNGVPATAEGPAVLGQYCQGGAQTDPALPAVLLSFWPFSFLLRFPFYFAFFFFCLCAMDGTQQLTHYTNVLPLSHTPKA